MAPYVLLRSLRKSQELAQAWTVFDLPLLDAARNEQEEMARVVDHLLAVDDSDMQVMSMLRGALVDDAAGPGPEPDSFAGGGGGRAKEPSTATSR